MREEESINLLREQVQQMRKIKIESDHKDELIMQLQLEVRPPRPLAAHHEPLIRMRSTADRSVFRNLMTTSPFSATQ